MERKCLIVLAFAIATGCTAMAFAPEGFAQSPEILELKKTYDARIAETQAFLDAMRTMTWWLLLATLLVVVLGAISAFLQVLKKRWVKPITAALGIAIALVTSIVQIVFDTDYRTVRTATVELQQKLKDAKLLVKDIHLKDDQAARNNVTEIQKILVDISGMEKKFKLLAFAIELMPSAYAQQAPLPPWAQSAPGSMDRGGFFFQFVGRAEDADLAKAREQSLQDAIERAAGVLADQLKAGKLEQLPRSEADAMRNYVRQGAVIAETYFTQGPSGQYQAYTQIKLDKSFLSPEVLRVVLPRLVSKPVAVVEPVLLKWRHRTLLKGEFDRKVAVYVGDVQPDAAFRVVIYVPKPDAPIMTGARGPIPTALVQAESQSVLFNQRVDPKARQVDFAHNQRTYRLTFETVGRKDDQVVFEVFRIK